MIEFKKQVTENRIVTTVAKWIADIIVVVFLAYFIVNYTCERYSVVGHSMEPNFENGDVVLVNKIEYHLSKPKRYDTVAIEAKEGSSVEYHIKRIVGLPGETVQIKNSIIYINDQPLNDDVIDADIYNVGIADNKIELGKDEYFVLGDNRNNSDDSRSQSFGNVKIDNIIGSVWFRVLSFEKFGKP